MVHKHLAAKEVVDEILGAEQQKTAKKKAAKKKN